MRMSKKLLVCVVVVAGLLATVYGQDWKPVEGRIMTKWAKDVGPRMPLPEYPRPIMERETWRNLNGLWDYAIAAKDAAQPVEFQGKILVPYPIESALSGVGKTVGGENRLWYKRSFRVPRSWSGKRVLLHFGAVDFDATILVNGKEVVSHKGGYDPFVCDITDALKTGMQELVVSVWDPTDDGSQARGKQVKNPSGIWYTAVTGIWQTVWMEPVAEASIAALKNLPDIDKGVLNVTALGRGAKDGDVVEAFATAGDKVVASAKGTVGKTMQLKVANAKLWSPDSPFLYDLKVTLTRGDKVLDTVTSYFGMRKMALAKDDKGVQRLFLNNKPLFQYGPLDQGWWPDGLYTAPTDEALRYDLEVLKKIGCNMLRKHVKVEPERLYYWCDKMGLLVWQDMPSSSLNDKVMQTRGKEGAVRSPESAREFESELKEMIDTLYSYPSIVMWVPFNEGWGQYDTERITAWIKQYDPSRLVNNASGWTDKKVGDVLDIHNYPGPAIPALEENRAVVLGEFGGLGLPLKDHLWGSKRNWGYRTYEETEVLKSNYANLIAKLLPMIGKGLCAAVYTQTTDVEGEVNGWMTYDRAILKMPADFMADLNNRLYEPAPEMKTVVPTAEEDKGIVWRYTTEKPADDWMKVDFDASGWKNGKAGFGTKMTPGAIVGTEWSTKAIWIRRSFSLDSVPDMPFLSVHHDEDAVIYINGEKVASFEGYTSSYQLDFNGAALKKALKKGKNVIAVSCVQDIGGQYIDVGIGSMVPKK